MSKLKKTSKKTVEAFQLLRSLGYTIPEVLQTISEEPAKKDNVPLVGMREFIDSSDYLGMDREVWPGVKDDLVAMCQPGIHGAIVEQGIGGGKSYRIGIKLLYDLYTLAYQEVILEINPRVQYSLDPEAMVSVANVSLRADQAKKVVFGYISTFVKRSPWFQEYLPHDPTIKSELRFSRPYSIFPGHGHQSSVIGLNLFSCAIDEINFFMVADSSSASGLDYAAEMWDAIESRIRSRFGLHGFIGGISSRRTINDFSARKKRAIEADPETAKHFYIPPARAAWDDWPDKKKRFLSSGGVCRWRQFDQEGLFLNGDPLPYEEIEDKPSLWVPETLWGPFATNPEAALRDHASIPAEAVEPFFRKRGAIEPEWEMESPVKAGVQPSQWLTPGVAFGDLVEDWFWGDPDEVYHFHVDLARRYDACGLSIARNSGTDAVALSKGERRPERAALVDIDLLLQIKAPPGGEIEFAQVRRILYWLRDERGFKFRRSSFDGWQSVDSQQILTRRGFLIEQLSVDRNLEPYTNLKEAVYEGRCFFAPAKGQTKETPWGKVVDMANAGDPYAVFQVELVRLEMINNKKVDHPPNGSKDVADAAAGALTQAIRQIRLGRIEG